HADGFDLAGTVDQPQDLDTGQGLDLHLDVRYHFAVIEVFRKASDPVAAHLGFTAVRIKHPHLEVGDLGREDQNQAVPADPKLTVIDFAADIRQAGLLKHLDQPVDDNEIVPDPVHLGEFQTTDSLHALRLAARLF